jgi:hypothetical protein
LPVSLSILQSFGVLRLKEWSYVLLRRDEQGTIVESTEVTDEVLFLYRMIEMQERALNSYRKQLGYPFLITEPSSVIH